MAVSSARKLVIRGKIVGSMNNRRRRIQAGSLELTTRSLFPVIIVGKQDIFRGNAEERDKITEEEEKEIEEADKQRISGLMKEEALEVEGFKGHWN